MICGANFIYLQACHLFTLQTRTFWDDIFDLVSRRPPKSYSWRSTLVRTHEPRFLELPEVRRFIPSWIHQIPAILKQMTDSRSRINSAIISHNVRRSVNYAKSSEHLHECFLVTKQIFHHEAHSRIYLRIRQLWRFEGERFAKFPNTSPSGKRVDSDDPFPRIISWILVKNVTLGMLEWIRAPW
jgi:hypothetical protein